MFSTFSPTTPSLFLDVDRDKAQALGVPISDVFSALQASLGGFYVNDFNLFGRTWQVNIQAEAEDRDDIPDIWRIRVRSNRGEMVPLRAFADIRTVVGPQTIQRYNNFRSLTINGAPRPGVSSGDALAAMEQLSARVLPPGYGYRMDRHRLPGEAGGRADRSTSWRSPCCSPTCSSSRSTRAGPSPSRCCFRWWWAASVPSWRS